MEQSSSAITKTGPIHDLVQDISAAVKRLALYPAGHPACIKAAEKPYATLEAIWAERATVVISLAASGLVVDGIALEPRWGDEGLGKIMKDTGVHSLSFTRGLTQENFQQFINYLSTKPEDIDFVDFLKSNRINNITVDKWHYELIGEDEEVISTDLVGDRVEGAREVRETIIETLKNNPELLVELLADPKGKGGSMSLGTNPESDDLGGSGAGAAAGEGDATGAGFLSLDSADAMVELEDLSDEQLLNLLVSGLRRAVELEPERRKTGLGRALFAIKDFLERRDNPELLSKLREALQGSGIIDERELELILKDDASPESIARIEIDNFRKAFLSDAATRGDAPALFRWIDTVADSSFVEQAFQDLYSDFIGLSSHLSPNQKATIDSLIDTACSKPDSHTSAALIAELTSNLSDTGISLAAFSVLAGQARRLFDAAIAAHDFESADRLYVALEKVCSVNSTHQKDIISAAESLRWELGSPEQVRSLLAELSEDFPRHSKGMTPLLERFTSRHIATVFAEQIAAPDRGVRMLMIRLLSQMGEPAILALEDILHEYHPSNNHKGKSALDSNDWYRLRNFILVLGNIGSIECLGLLESFADHQDDRVVGVVLEAFERIGSADAAVVVSKLLTHSSLDVRRKALRVLAQIGTGDQWDLIRDFFIQNPSERSVAISLLADLDRERTINFLSQVLDGDALALQKFSIKADESLNELIVNTFIKWKLERTDECLRRFVKGGSKSLLGHFRKPTSVKLAERYLKRRPK